MWGEYIAQNGTVCRLTVIVTNIECDMGKETENATKLKIQKQLHMYMKTYITD